MEGGLKIPGRGGASIAFMSTDDEGVHTFALVGGSSRSEQFHDAYKIKVKEHDIKDISKINIKEYDTYTPRGSQTITRSPLK